MQWQTQGVTVSWSAVFDAGKGKNDHAVPLKANSAVTKALNCLILKLLCAEILPRQPLCPYSRSHVTSIHPTSAAELPIDPYLAHVAVMALSHCPCPRTTNRDDDTTAARGTQGM